MSWSPSDKYRISCCAGCGGQTEELDRDHLCITCAEIVEQIEEDGIEKLKEEQNA